MMGIFRRVLAVGTIGGVLALIPVGAVAAPPPKDGEPGHGHGANQPAGQGHAPGQPPGHAHGTDQPPGHSQGAGQPPGHSQGAGQRPGNGQGANQPGPYDPNGVGQPSGNGKSEDNNGNRPCAGCVGNADAKNPPGQMPGGSDGNAGYECDRNQGVGKTNPAHSGCGPAPASPPQQPPGGGPPEQPPKQPPGGGPPEQPPAGGAPPQSAGPTQPQATPDGRPAPEKTAAKETEPAVVLTEREGRGAPAGEKSGEAPKGRPVKLKRSAGHPFTGSLTLVLLGLGVLALVVGGGARRFSSHHRA